MDPSEEVCRSLVKWLQTLVPQNTRSVVEISDGVGILKALLQISYQNFYKLESKIKTEVGSNWRLKVSNLKKINEAIQEYYQDILNLQLLDIGRPDVQKLGETADLIQLGKLLRLLLGCAVNCERKEEYIPQIMALEESVQSSIMEAIQQLEELTGVPGISGLSLLSLDNESRILKLQTELEVANEAKDRLAQQCHNLESKVQVLLEEKQVLITDNQELQTRIKKKDSNDNPRGLDNRRQILLQEEIYKLENLKDDYQAKVVEQDKQIISLQEKIAELQLAADATARLKDEIDALTESADKVKNLEIAVASYKKRLEDYTVIKKQVKQLEEKNVEYLQQNLKYEEEIKKHNVWKNQSELYKNQSAELQTKLDDEIQNNHKLMFQNKNLESKLEALIAEKERTARERDTLREENEELQLNKNKVEDGAAMAHELAPTEIKERLRHLEKENNNLRQITQEAEAKQALLEDAMSRLEKLSEQKSAATQRILELEQELQNSNAKYARSVEKVREVASTFDSKSNGSLDSMRHSNMKEDEVRLITTAFYQLSHQCHRDAVDERLALISAGQGQSFLTRQRQPIPRKSVTPYKSK